MQWLDKHLDHNTSFTILAAAVSLEPCKWLGDLSSRVAELFRLLRSTLLSLSLIDDVVVRISTLAMSPIFLSPSAKKLNDSQLCTF